MKKFAFCLLAATALSATGAMAQELNYTVSEPIKFPRTIYAGEMAGVATNSRGHIYVFQRAGNPFIAMGAARIFTHGQDQLLQFDQNGNFVRELGKANYAATVANSVRVDAKDNVWSVDRTGNTVIKYAPDGSRILMLLGRKPEAINITIAGGAGRGTAPAAGRGGRGGVPGAGAQSDVFSGPSDVAFDAAGNIFVSDGWGANNRVAKFTPDGVFIKSFGKTGDDNESLNSPRSLAVDAVGNVYVADGGNRRIQVLSNDLTYVRTITGVGEPSAICISPGATQYLYVSNSNPMDNLDTGGEIYKLQLNGTVVGRFGKAGKAPREFASVNQMDCRQPNVIYTAESGSWRVQKVTLRP